MTINTRHLVDPQLVGLLDTIPSAELNPETLALMRGAPMMFAVRPEDVARTEMAHHTAPGRDGAPDVPVIIYRPMDAEGALPCILHIHGGGYVLGSAAAGEAAHRPLAAELGCCIVTVDYRPRAGDTASWTSGGLLRRPRVGGRQRRNPED